MGRAVMVSGGSLVVGWGGHRWGVVQWGGWWGLRGVLGLFEGHLGW